jgi:molecular chaperone GrpE
LTSGWQRTQADFVNYKKQASDEKVRLIKTANENLIAELLPILDNFQLAAKHVPAELENNNWAQGVKQIEKQLENVLSGEGLDKIESMGKEFDPLYHEAIEEVKSKEPKGTIVEEVLAGYIFNGEVLRPARVKVSAGK